MCKDDYNLFAHFLFFKKEKFYINFTQRIFRTLQEFPKIKNVIKIITDKFLFS